MFHLEKSIREFEEKNLEKCNRKYINLEKTLKSFIKRFPIEELKNISIDDYVVGKGKENESFCYWLETKLIDFGTIKGSSTADKMFGIYYSKKAQTYLFAKKWGEDWKLAYDNIIKEIMVLLENGKNKNFEAISMSKLAPMFRAKILATYFPDDYLCIFSPKHIEHFLEILRRNINNNIEINREELLNVKKEHPIMKNWSNYAYMCFLYTYLNPKYIENTMNEKQQEDFFNAIDVNACYITSEKFVKIRKANLKLVKELKELYDGRCQLCGKKVGEEFGDDSVVEGHHIEYFSTTQKHSKDNLMILCPNHHSIIHKFDPIFDKDTKSFNFKNGVTLKLLLNKHL